MTKAYRIIVSGQVHGVGYRINAKRRADKLDLGGYVMNQPNGSVLIEAEGAAEKLNKLVGWCRSGPKHAEVNHVEVSDIEPQQFVDFEIKN